jgi:hypothetical protein
MRFATTLALFAAAGAAHAACLPADVFCDVQDIPAPTNAVQIVYAPKHHKLLVRNAGSAIATVDTGPAPMATMRFSNASFSDMSLSPSGDFVYAADYNGEVIGYGIPAAQHYVHRLDVRTGAWDSKTAFIASRVQATDDDHFVLKSGDQWVSFWYDLWGADPGVTVLNPPNSWSTGYYAAVYFGDFRFDRHSGRLIHGNSGSSSDEIQAFRISNNTFSYAEGTGTYGSAQGNGHTVALANDGSAFYFGRLQVEAIDVTHNLRTFPSAILAATADVAFSATGDFYDAHTGAPLGTIGYATQVYAVNPSGRDFWAFDAANNMLRHYRPYEELFVDDFE